MNVLSDYHFLIGDSCTSLLEREENQKMRKILSAKQRGEGCVTRNNVFNFLPGSQEKCKKQHLAKSKRSRETSHLDTVGDFCFQDT